MTTKVLVVPTVRKFNLFNFGPKFPGEVWFVGSKDDVNTDIQKDRFIGRKERLEFLKGVDTFEMKEPGLCRSELSVAYLMAYQEGFDLIYTLDDDTIPIERTFYADHEMNIDSQCGWNKSAPVVNPLELPYFARGFPYRYRDHYEEKARFEDNADIVFSLGLWKGVPDVNFADYPTMAWDADLSEGITQSYMPLCTMNICFKAWLAPVYLQPPLKRFDDIFAGYVLERLMKEYDMFIHYGYPHVMHLKNPCPMGKFTYLQNESLPIIEMVPDALDLIQLPETDLIGQYIHIAHELPKVWKWIGKEPINTISKSMLKYAQVAQKI